MSFSPFTKNINDLTVDDLTPLRDVSEGWYVEYKRDLPNARSIAKTVSSFANSDGGWIFYGVEELSRAEPTAGQFPGIEMSDRESLVQGVRQAVAAHLSPAPHFDAVVLQGPCEALSLGANRAILVVSVPWSPTAPHIHSGGQVYRRVADGSEPFAENDRFAFDQLFRRSRRQEKALRKWVARDPGLSKGEKKTPFLRVLLSADLWGTKGLRMKKSHAEFRNIMGDAGAAPSIPFDVIQSIETGYLCRQVMGNNPASQGMSMHVSYRLNCDTLLPLPWLDATSIEEAREWLEGYESADEFSKVLREAHFRSVRITDLTMLFGYLQAVTNIYRRILSASGYNGTYQAKVVLLNVWRRVAFVDSSKLLSSFGTRGIPISFRRRKVIPGGSHPDTFFPIESSEGSEPLDASTMNARQALELFEAAGLGFGMSGLYDFEGTVDDRTAFVGDLLDVRRATEVQRLRNVSSRTAG